MIFLLALPGLAVFDISSFLQIMQMQTSDVYFARKPVDQRAEVSRYAVK